MVKKALAALALTLGLLAPSILAAAPAQAATERYIWTACGDYGYRQIGPDDSRIMRFRSCVRAHQVPNVITTWRTDKINTHGEVLCRVNVPHTSAPIADRFRQGVNHACSMNLVVGFTFANGEEPGDAQTSDQWTVSNSGNDGLWFKCLGDSCSTLNGYWDNCQGEDAWHARFDWIDGGLDGHRRYGTVHQSRSDNFLC